MQRILGIASSLVLVVMGFRIQELALEIEESENRQGDTYSFQKHDARNTDGKTQLKRATDMAQWLGLSGKDRRSHQEVIKLLDVDGTFAPAPTATLGPEQGEGSGPRLFSWESPSFWKSFGVICVAELFDRTWFLGLVLSMKFGWKAAFVGSYGALSVHTVVCAAIGWEMARHIKASTLQFATACLFFFFSILWARGALYADTEGNFLADSVAEAKEECNEHCQENEAQEQNTMCDSASTPAEQPPNVASPRKPQASMLKDSATCFLLVFIGEIGDRTQIAMLSLHGSLPTFPVWVGSELAFSLLVASATLCAEFVKQHGQCINQRMLLSCACVAFVVFAIVALRDACALKAQGL